MNKIKIESRTAADQCVTHLVYHSDVASLQCLSHHAAVTERGREQGREREPKEAEQITKEADMMKERS